MCGKDREEVRIGALQYLQSLGGLKGVFGYWNTRLDAYW